MGMPAPVYFTRAMVLDLPEDGNRYELVRGELLVTPAPRLRHQLVIGRLYERLSSYLRKEPVGEALFSPADISWGREDVLIQPDLFVIALEDARRDEWALIRRVLLAVEVLSLSSVRQDRFTKRLEYQRQGVPLYWIVDLEQPVVEVWTPVDHFPRFERERLSWQPAGASRAFEIELSELFRPI